MPEKLVRIRTCRNLNHSGELEFYSKNNRKYSTTAEYIFFFKKTKIVQSIFSNHKWIKLEINNRRKTGKFKDMQKINNPLLNNQWDKEKSHRKLENTLRWLRIKNKISKLILIRIQQKRDTPLKEVFRGKFIAVNVYTKKDVKSTT